MRNPSKTHKSWSRECKRKCKRNPSKTLFFLVKRLLSSKCIGLCSVCTLLCLFTVCIDNYRFCGEVYVSASWSAIVHLGRIACLSLCLPFNEMKIFVFDKKGHLAWLPGHESSYGNGRIERKNWEANFLPFSAVPLSWVWVWDGSFFFLLSAQFSFTSYFLNFFSLKDSLSLL